MSLLVIALAHATDGQVTLPLAAWNDLHPPAVEATLPTDAVHHDRRLVGSVDRGLLEATLTHRVEALRPTDLPVLPGDATVVRARLDGGPAPLTRSDRYRIALTPGAHDLRLDLLQGQASDRSERRVRLALPPGGPTAFELTLPEAPVDVALASGVVTETAERVGHTVVKGWVDGTGALDLSWERRTTHEATDARLDAEVFALLDLGGDLVVGQGSYRFDVLAGEVDRVALELPVGVEVTEVTGPQVLQWHSRDGQLAVLLREVADEAVALTVGYQYPTDLDGPTELQLPLPDTPVRGALGVVAPVAMQVELAEVHEAVRLPPRDIPQDLVELSADPLRAAVAFDEPPRAAATTTRQGEVLTSASRIDDLQGISLLMEDGTEVGKLRLAVRNADRQALSVQLPAGARLTHCYRDGAPLKPAADREAPDRVMVPLTRSQRSAQRAYTVQPGDTMSQIAADNYGDATTWTTVAAANPHVDSGNLQVGQVLQLPTVGDTDVQSFVLELGWERRTDPLRPVGTRQVALPSLDLEVMAATWHLYVPEHIEPLSVDASLTQVSGLRADPLTRFVDLLVHHGATGSSAYASGPYKNVLSKRRSYFEAAQQQQAAAPLSSYPLVGQRLRFRGHLLGTEAPTATFRYVGAGIGEAVRWVAWGLALLVAGWLARRPRDRAPWATAAAGLGLGAVVGHYLLGTYAALVGGANLGLLFGLLPWLWAHRRWPARHEVVIAFVAGPPAALLLLVKPALAPLAVLTLLLSVVWRSR